MHKELKILNTNLLESFKLSMQFDVESALNNKKKEKVPVDYFQFYNSISSVYSSKIEGEEIDFDSFFKHKFLKVKFEADYTKKADDLMSAYEFTFNNELNFENVKEAHSILSKNLLSKPQRGVVRNNPMFVVNEEDEIEYVAAEPNIIIRELEKLFSDIEVLKNENVSLIETFYYASLIHLVFVKIHPFQEGNGRTARLIEKWFLMEKLGEKGVSISSEKYYYKNLKSYYRNIKKLGLEYNELDFRKSLDFLLMTINSMRK